MMDCGHAGDDKPDEVSPSDKTEYALWILNDKRGGHQMEAGVYKRLPKTDNI